MNKNLALLFSDYYFINKLRQQAGEALMDVPKAMRTMAICRLALPQAGEALMGSESMRTEEICRLAVQQDSYAFSYALQHVTESIRILSICRLAVQQGRLFVQQDGHALKHVPQAMRTEATCRLAVQQHSDAFEYVPSNQRSNQFYVDLAFANLAKKDQTIFLSLLKNEYKDDMDFLVKGIKRDCTLVMHENIRNKPFIQQHIDELIEHYQSMYFQQPPHNINYPHTLGFFKLKQLPGSENQLVSFSFKAV